MIDALRLVAANLPATKDLLDLQAQQDMAFWAKWMFWGTVVSIVLSAFALLAVLGSLRQTSRAIGDARKLGEDQTRAYVHVNSAKHSWTDVGYGLVLSIENVGETPARVFEIGGRLQKAKIGEVSGVIVPATYPMKRWAAVGPKVPATTVRLDTAAFNDLIVEFRQPVAGHVLLLTGTVRYQDIYNKWFETDFAFFSHTAITGEPDRESKLRRPTAQLRSYVSVEPPPAAKGEISEKSEIDP
ncbi:hypothetical protein A4R29_11070 [Mesorhizobium ciceri biovar biserrulae]|nr:hypothetical protein A4R29_11070 [Mesorhizobium ciceri biovar biserrulae]